MATHRPPKMRGAPEPAFPLALDVLDVTEDQTARRRPATPQTLASRLCARAFGPHPTPLQLQAALTQATRWREQRPTRDLLDQRRQLLALRIRAETELNRLSEDIAYLTIMVHETEAVLRGTWNFAADAAPDAGAHRRSKT